MTHVSVAMPLYRHPSGHARYGRVPREWRASKKHDEIRGSQQSTLDSSRPALLARQCSAAAITRGTCNGTSGKVQRATSGWKARAPRSRRSTSRASPIANSCVICVGLDACAVKKKKSLEWPLQWRFCLPFARGQNTYPHVYTYSCGVDIHKRARFRLPFERGQNNFLFAIRTRAK